MLLRRHRDDAAKLAEVDEILEAIDKLAEQSKVDLENESAETAKGTKKKAKKKDPKAAKEEEPEVAEEVTEDETPEVAE